MAAYSKYANFDLSKPEDEIGFIGKKNSILMKFMIQYLFNH